MSRETIYVVDARVWRRMLKDIDARYRDPLDAAFYKLALVKWIERHQLPVGQTQGAER